jgi:ferritin
MNTNRLSTSLHAGLNNQINKEAEAAEIYLSYASWASYEGLDGIANFLFRHAQEERNHMMKILEYILERGAEVKLKSIPAPPPNPNSVQNCFEKIFEQEISNTAAIYALVKTSLEEQDWATWNFLQWFVKEQTEEETLALQLLNKIKVAGGESVSPDALYILDQELSKIPDEVTLAEEKTAENP